MKSKALHWIYFKSYLSTRSFSVTLGDTASLKTSLSCGVYTLPVAQLKKKNQRKHGISFHYYADDSQIYLPLKLKCMSPLKVLLDCLDNDTGWMALNLLNLNEQKTEAIVFGPCDLYDFGPLGIYKVEIGKEEIRPFLWLLLNCGTNCLFI